MTALTTFRAVLAPWFKAAPAVTKVEDGDGAPVVKVEVVPTDEAVLLVDNVVEVVSGSVLNVSVSNVDVEVVVGSGVTVGMLDVKLKVLVKSMVLVLVLVLVLAVNEIWVLAPPGPEHVSPRGQQPYWPLVPSQHCSVAGQPLD